MNANIIYLLTFFGLIVCSNGSKKQGVNTMPMGYGIGLTRGNGMEVIVLY